MHRQMLPPLRLPAFFCWAASSLLCKSVRHKSRRQLQQQARCPAFPITKTAHIGFSCVHHFPSCSSQNRCFSKSVRIPRTAHRRFCVPYPCTGSSTAMVVPLSELSSTRTEPPWRSAISHTKESPSPDAAVLPAAGFIHPEEGLKDAPLIFLRNAAAGVGDADQKLFRLLRDRNPSPSRPDGCT